MAGQQTRVAGVDLCLPGESGPEIGFVAIEPCRCRLVQLPGRVFEEVRKSLG